MSNRNRARGALLGLAVGDALGTTLEFSSPDAPKYPTLAVGPHTTITGGGPFDVLPGQVTDDTQLATALACSLRANNGLNLTDLARRYSEWLKVAFDVGTLTRNALSRIANGADPLTAGYLAWCQSGKEAAGNGSLMRCTPIALLAPAPEALLEWSCAESSLTHFDPRCQLACAGFNAAIAAAVHSGSEPLEMVDEAAYTIREAAQMLRQLWFDETVAIDSAEEDLTRDLRRGGMSTPDLYGSELHLLRHEGFVRIAFRLAFWHLLHQTPFEEALIDVVNRGGDADTNAAIVGALLGAVQGEEAIPASWRSMVLGALAGQNGELATTYHPRTLLEQLS